MNAVVLFQGSNRNHGGLLLADSTNSWSVASYAKDLGDWVPRLIAVWRRARKLPDGPAHTLLPRELQEVASGVRTLSLGLTRDRMLAGAPYMDDPKLLGAYLLFFWPVSYAQARELFGELPHRPRSCLDLGSGPGPVAFAALDAGASDVTCADRSRAALKLATELAKEAGEALATREWTPDAPLPDGRFDVITLGHVVNELYGRPESSGVIAKRTALLSTIAASVKPQGSLLVMDPALRETSRALLQVRDAWVQGGGAVRAPCFFKGPCPALIKESDWCHAEREWSPPPVIAAIAREAGLKKEALKMSYLMLSPPGEAWAKPPDGQVFRIVSESLASKGRNRFMGCGASGRIGLAMQDKHLGEANKAFAHLRRGDVVRVEGTEPRGDGLALGETSAVTFVAHVGQPIPRR